MFCKGISWPLKKRPCGNISVRSHNPYELRTQSQYQMLSKIVSYHFLGNFLFFICGSHHGGRALCLSMWEGPEWMRDSLTTVGEHWFIYIYTHLFTGRPITNCSIFCKNVLGEVHSSQYATRNYTIITLYILYVTDSFLT